MYTIGVDQCTGSDSTEQRVPLRVDNNCSNPYETGQSGTITQDISAWQFGGDTIYVYAYARNVAGVAYSPNPITWTPTPCLAEGTLITLADGTTKAIESVTMSDTLKAWDFDTGVATTAPVLWLQRKQSTTQYNVIEFSDGTKLKTISQHRIFNKQSGKFTYPMTEDTPIGTTTVKADGTEVTVVAKKVVYGDVNYYNIIAGGGHMNCYAEGVLTSMRYNNIYPITDMRYVKDSRVLKDRSTFTGIADRWIDGLRLPEQSIDLKSTQRYVKRLEANEQLVPRVTNKPSWLK
jgi:hypothetical protein